MSQGAKTVEMTWEDQMRINAFSKLNTNSHDVAARIRALKAEMEQLEDASNELMLLDEEEVRHTFGECFVHISKDQSEQEIESAIAESKSELAELQESFSNIQKEMVKLKGVLYGKFGNSINLEEE